MDSPKHYRHFSEGCVTVYGNSAEITETFNALSKEQIHELAEQEYLTGRETAWRRYDYHFRKHVLEYGHNFGKVEFWYDQYLDRKKKKREQREQATPVRKQGDIQEFSYKSRSRMLKRINQVDPERTHLLYHVTLTYPERFPTDGETHKTDLDVFIKRIKRMFGKQVELLWKLEFQSRGAPHYHILLFIPDEYSLYYLREWFKRNWREVAQRFWDEKIENHKRVSCDPVDCLRKAGFYLSKYLTKKEDDTPPNQGRYWGCTRNWGDLIEKYVKLTGEQLIYFRRYMKRYLKGNSRIQKILTAPMNVTVFAHWKVTMQLLEWVKQVH